MYKILIADDEGITVDALKFIINKYFPGQCTVEAAKTGREVIMLAETFRPDIAFMDIHMPGINGIEAIREIKKNQPNIHVVIISAYDKFSYAKTAIELGVMKYINKPFEQKQIVEVLSYAISKLDSDRSRKNEALLIREKLENVIPIIQNGFINDLLFKEHFDEDIENFKRLLEIDADYGFMLVLVFGEKKEGNHMTNASGAAVFLQNRYVEIRNLIENVFPEAVVGNSMANKIAALIPYRNAALDYNGRAELVNKALKFVKECKSLFDICVRAGFGLIKPINDMSESYREAVTSLIQSTRTVAHAEDVSVNVEYEHDYPIDLERMIFEAVKSGHKEESATYAERFYNWLIYESGGAEGDIRLKVIEFVLWAEHIAYEQAGLCYVFKSRTNYLDTVNTLSLELELKDWFCKCIRKSAESIANVKTEKLNGIIKKSLKFIHANFSKDISLDDVSYEVDVTPYYFSRLFKEEIGVNFIEYVTNLRINKAKELLANEDFSMKEICMEVGYADPNYFSRTFKKREGVSPSEYREGLK